MSIWISWSRKWEKNLFRRVTLLMCRRKVYSEVCLVRLGGSVTYFSRHGDWINWNVWQRRYICQKVLMNRGEGKHFKFNGRYSKKQGCVRNHPSFGGSRRKPLHFKCAFRNHSVNLTPWQVTTANRIITIWCKLDLRNQVDDFNNKAKPLNSVFLLFYLLVLSFIALHVLNNYFNNININGILTQ